MGDMKIERGQSKASALTEQIEIIRDTPPQSDGHSSPTLQDEHNPLHALAELVEKLEALEDLSFRPDTQELELGDHAQSESTRREYMSQVDHYLTLFQKQSAVLRKLSGKLN